MVDIVAVLPAYSTPRSKVSASFISLLYKTRIPVLKAIIELDNDQVSDYVIPGSSFVPLAMHLEVVKEYSDQTYTQELPLWIASLYLGSFESFKLIAFELPPSGPTLHLAAVLALPKFVKWLLEDHDPNHKLKNSTT
ncbi:hypothetical protein DL98DRAFT_608024 [Cadophora sp. DSE1049]|nr:hypothetical protein DL98DRAFT_608024 [Cadophora sp. DSE1049]